MFVFSNFKLKSAPLEKNLHLTFKILSQFFFMVYFLVVHVEFYFIYIKNLTLNIDLYYTSKINNILPSTLDVFNLRTRA